MLPIIPTVCSSFSCCFANALDTLSVISTLTLELAISSLTSWLIWSVDFLDSSARTLISSATTANPLPCSPALAASILALRARRLVWLDIPAIISVTLLICCADSLVRPVCSITLLIASSLSLLISTNSDTSLSTSLLSSFKTSSLSVRHCILSDIWSIVWLMASILAFISLEASSCNDALLVILSTALLLSFIDDWICDIILSKSFDTVSISTVAFLIPSITSPKPSALLVISLTSIPKSSSLPASLSNLCVTLLSLFSPPPSATNNGCSNALINSIIPANIAASIIITRINATNVLITPCFKSSSTPIKHSK